MRGSSRSCPERKRERLGLGPGLCAVLLLLGVACAGTAPVTLRPAPEGGWTATLEAPGRLVPPPGLRHMPRLASVRLANRGAAPIDDLRLEGPAGGLVRTDALAEDPVAFALLPGEQAGLRDGPGGRLRIDLLWLRSALRPGSTFTLTGADTWSAGALSGLVLEPIPGGEARRIEFPLTSPYAHESARVAWQVAPAEAQVEVWVGLAEGAWARVPDGRPWQDRWLHPLELGPAVQGQRHFRLRLVARLSAEPTRGIHLRRLRIERTAGARARLAQPAAGEALWIGFEPAVQARLKVQLEREAGNAVERQNP